MNKKEKDSQPSRREAGFQGFGSGSGFALPIPAARKVGTATLVAGTVTVPDPQITANSIIIITPQEGGALAGITRISARVVGTSFTITSLNVLDTAVIGYLIFEP